MVAMWIAHEAQVNAAKAAGSATGVVLERAQNAQTIQSAAGTGAADAYKAVVGIPYIGPFIAPAAAAVAYAGISAFSAAGGFDIPPGVNPLTQLHASEMVLPANLAQGVRNMTAQGG